MRILDDRYSIAVEMVIHPSVELARFYPVFDTYKKLWVISSRIPGPIPVELDTAYKTEEAAWDAICGYIDRILTCLEMSGYNLAQLDDKCPDELWDFYVDMKLIHNEYRYSMYRSIYLKGMLKRV